MNKSVSVSIPPTGSAGVVSQSLAFARRDILLLFHNSSSLISAVFIPSIFLLAFYAAFSNSADLLGIEYLQFLLPAAMMQVIVFAAGGSSLAVATDAETNMISRFRSMPVSAIAVVSGRLLADLFRVLYSGVIVLAVAFLLGFRFHGSWSAALGVIAAFAVLTVVVCGFASGLVLLTKSPMSTSLLIQGLIIPILVFSTAFVPEQALPKALGAVIRHVPLSVILTCVRDLIDGSGLGGAAIEAGIWLVVLSCLACAGFAAAFRRSSHV